MTLAREMALESEYVMGTFARKPVEFVEGNGMVLIDDTGKSTSTSSPASACAASATAIPPSCRP